VTLRITRASLKDGSLRARWKALSARHPDLSLRSEAEMAAILDQMLAAHDPAQDIHVFGYGSLIWNPAFEFIDSAPALVRGLHRRFCLKLTMGRGTPERPGLMLALDYGGACKGVVFRIAAEQAREELELLWAREMYGGAYNARWVTATTPNGPVRAITFVINRRHPRYVPELSVAQTAAFIATGAGDLGSCMEYLENTVQHLAELGLRDAGLERIVAALPKPEASAS
jgi:cation transport protein ChaC